ncbi:hypothetical protein [Paenibacillus arenilitoris]|uniref:Uncharacterized protein n=1 Tax=Paenibacillus arenilitoris TaxID=2772299 RepID=A0A927H9E2_9BACL|nr:hypothetical protein [Paenibacillus arenilitoris]MBD2871519.1 hypothetical protein [Paenibacillus arenilitoris]
MGKPNEAQSAGLAAGPRPKTSRKPGKKTMMRRKPVRRYRLMQEEIEQAQLGHTYNEGYNAGFAKGFEDGHQKAYEQQR